MNPDVRKLPQKWRDEAQAMARHKGDEAIVIAGTYKQCAHELEAALAAQDAARPAEAGDTTLRRLLALRYSGTAIYTDDGELQDNATRPAIDLLRDDPAEIERKIHERARAALSVPAAPAIKRYAPVFAGNDPKKELLFLAESPNGEWVKFADLSTPRGPGRREVGDD